jgi:hypothetical protein
MEKHQPSATCIFRAAAYAPSMSNSTGDNNFIKEDPWRIFRIMAEFV